MAYIPRLFRHPAFEKISIDKILSRKPFVVLGKPGFRYAFEKDFFCAVFPDITAPDLDNFSLRKEIYKKIVEARPAILVGFGSLISRLARLAEQDNVSLPLMAVRTSSEPIAPSEQKNIEEIFGAPVINMLSGNGTIIGFECPKNTGRFHVHTENVVLEVVQENGDITPTGEEGELVVTYFGYILTPRIRFAHNDVGKLMTEPCLCGRTLPLFEFAGRRGYNIILPSGKKIRMIHLHKALMDQGLGYKTKQIQVMQDKIDNLRITIVPRKKRLGDEGEMNVRLALTNLFEQEKINIEIEYVNSVLPGYGNKPQFFIPLQN
jgi:phenylacetate-CoA ligase